jgi:tetratricopeptide (TPR) repeat protein
MKRNLLFGVVAVLLQTVFLFAQTRPIIISAGTPEDRELQAITNEQDPQKKLAMYQDFVQKFSSNPEAVVYGNWQIAQYYQSTGDAQKALEYGDKALAGAPDNLNILVMQAGNAQRAKDNAKVMDYSTRGGKVYNSIGTQSKPEGMSDQNFADQTKEAKSADQGSYEFLEAAAYNAIVDETNAKTRMAYIERFTPAFPNSRYEDSVTSYAMVALSQLNDTPRVIAYGEKTLAANPNSLPTLLLLASVYVDDPKPGSTAKAIGYAQKVIAAAKADAPDADASRKLSAGAAHSTLGYAYMKQDKTAASIPELKAAIALLKGQDDQSYAVAAYRLGFAYAKLRQLAEAREVLTEAVGIPGPVQALCQDLLTKVNAARESGK